MFQKLGKICDTLVSQSELIPDERKGMLQMLSYYIRKKYEEGKNPKLLVISTHNARRSQIAQIWLGISAEYFNISKLEIYSGGLEVSEFDVRVINAFERIGIEIEFDNRLESNTKYLIKWNEKMEPLVGFSKKYEHKSNPQDQFCAIIVCSNANKKSPIVFGSEFKISIPFSDPQSFNDTDVEDLIYDSRVKQIGREMLFVLGEVRKELKVKTFEELN